MLFEEKEWHKQLGTHTDFTQQFTGYLQKLLPLESLKFVSPYNENTAPAAPVNQGSGNVLLQNARDDASRGSIISSSFDILVQNGESDLQRTDCGVGEMFMTEVMSVENMSEEIKTAQESFDQESIVSGGKEREQASQDSKNLKTPLNVSKERIQGEGGAEKSVPVASKTSASQEKPPPAEALLLNTTEEKGKSAQAPLEDTASHQALSAAYYQDSPVAHKAFVDATKALKALSPHFLMQQVVSGICLNLKGAREGAQILTLQLQPPELGVIKVRTRFEEGTLSLHFEGAETALHLLKSNSAELLKSLGLQGLWCDPHSLSFEGEGLEQGKTDSFSEEQKEGEKGAQLNEPSSEVSKNVTYPLLHKLKKGLFA